VLHAEPGRLLVHAVDEAGEPDCWLTWRLEPACGGTTRVQLALDELASTAPPPELDAVLVELLTAFVGVNQLVYVTVGACPASLVVDRLRAQLAAQT
jgi:hypothetical protein